MAIYNRDDILRDLRENVMAVYHNTENGQLEVKLTLMLDILPPSYIKEQELTFHSNNSNIVAAYDVTSRKWYPPIDIETISMVQALDHMQYM